MKIFIAKTIIFFLTIVPLFTLGQQAADSNRLIMTINPNAESGQKDFDFEIGSWNTNLRKLEYPLTGSTKWIKYKGTTIVKKILNGKGNIVELNVSGAKSDIEAISLRLYDPETRQWRLSFANMKDGRLAIPAVGKFREGRGEFYNEDSLHGRKILTRFIISQITVKSCHFEQSFSADDGRTWELNWVADDTKAVRISKRKAVRLKKKK